MRAPGRRFSGRFGVIILHYPRAQTWWERFLRRRRRCGVCGVRWMCDEAKKERYRRWSPRIRNDRTGAWPACTTMEYPAVGRAGSLTPAQAWRGNGGRGGYRV